MWLSVLLSACFSPAPSTTTVPGIQVVAIESDPSEPGTFDALTLRPWVADAYGAGADVLVWACTPIEGTCAEAWPPGSTGLPLPMWTHVGRADPFDEVTVAWPFLASLAGDALDLDVTHLVVWTLACAPGVCPIMDAVLREPVSGSDAWRDVVTALGEPAQLIEGLPPREVSLAVKLVPLYGAIADPDPLFEGDYSVTSTPSGAANRAPVLLDQTPSDLSPDAGLVSLYAVDPDGDPLHIRPFTTHGVIRTELDSETSLVSVLTRPLAESPVPPQRFVVVDDGRGGTSVWSDAVAKPSCSGPGISVTTPRRPGEPVLFTPYVGPVAGGGTFRVAGSLDNLSPLVQVTVAIQMVGSGLVLGRGGTMLASSGATCSSPFQFDLANRFEVCQFAGQLAEVVVTATSDVGTLTVYEPTFIGLADVVGCAP